MKISIWFGIGFVTSLSSLTACSAAPPSTVIIMEQAPPSGGKTSADDGGVPSNPITFGGNAGAANLPPAGSGPSPSPTGSTPGSMGGSPPGSMGTPAAASGLPCNVATYLAAKCTACHGNPPLPSALASLVTYDDLKATSKEDPTKNEAELSVARMQNASSPMPPGALPSASDVAILQDWINAGYPKGSCGTSAGSGTGTGTGTDGGIVATTPPASVFDGAPAFAAQLGRTAHNAGRDCMGCHRSGTGEAPQFSFGGTLYDGSGSPVAGAEVRFVDASGRASSVYTASNGTFYQGGSGFAAPAHVGVRDAHHSNDMISPLQASNGGACSSCHCTGTGCAISPIHLP